MSAFEIALEVLRARFSSVTQPHCFYKGSRRTNSVSRLSSRIPVGNVQNPQDILELYILHLDL